MRENRFLRDRMIGREHRRDDSYYDERNPYGSRGGYVVGHRDRNYNDSDYDYGNYKSKINDYGDYHMRTNDMFEKYEYDLDKWIEKLKKKDKFKMSKEEIINAAKSMGVKFDDYSHEEFLAVFYMLMSDFPQVANDYHTYLVMAKKWLEDDDIEVTPSEKLCIYLYDIVKGECV